jgi:hypothetical protein
VQGLELLLQQALELELLLQQALVPLVLVFQLACSQK